MDEEIREFIGGPLHKEWHVVQRQTTQIVQRLPACQCKNPHVPEFVRYQLKDDVFLFVGRGTDPKKIIAERSKS